MGGTWYFERWVTGTAALNEARTFCDSLGGSFVILRHWPHGDAYRVRCYQ